MTITNLRWFQTYDSNGVNSDIVLQYQEDDEFQWRCVTHTRIPEHRIDDLDTDE